MRHRFAFYRTAPLLAFRFNYTSWMPSHMLRALSQQRPYSGHSSDLHSRFSGSRCITNSGTEVVTHYSQVWLLLLVFHSRYGLGSKERISGRGVHWRVECVTLVTRLWTIVLAHRDLIVFVSYSDK